jgi:hypothetical protein
VSIRFAVSRPIFVPIPQTGAHPLTLPANDSFIEAIAERLRAVIARPGHQLDEIASILRVSREALQHLLNDGERPIDTGILIDVVAALVREFAVDPQWLLTGQYDSATHRQALLLREEHTNDTHAVREFVREQFRRLRESLRFQPPPPSPKHDF